MTKEELIKELEKLRDVENYSHYELMNTGYKTGLLDALDLVNKYFDLAHVSGSLCDYCKDGKRAVCCESCLDDMINQTANTQ